MGWVILIVLVVLALVAVAMIVSARKKKRSEGLQERFGPEYDRAVSEHGDRKAAESHLGEVADRREKLEVRELSTDERASFLTRWDAVQSAFVDHPSRAVRDADHLVGEVMRERGYPVDDFETKYDMVAVDHPEVARHYRAAHQVGSSVDQHGTEDLRQGFVHYRELFERLLSEGMPAPVAADTGRDSEPGRRADHVDRADHDDTDTRTGTRTDPVQDGGAAEGRPVDLTEPERTRQVPPGR